MIKYLLACLIALAAITGPASADSLTRPEIIGTTIQPFHPDTGLDVTTVMYDDLAYLEVRTVRVEFIAMRTRDVIDFASYDYVMDQLQNRGIEVLGLIDYQSLQTKPSEWGTPEFRERFVSRTREIVAHYTNRENPIIYWEIWNEQDLSVPEFNVRVEPEPYGAILAACYDAIKAIYPDAQVLMGGISPKGFTYLDKPNYLAALYETEAFQRYHEAHGIYPFDIAACHPYPEVFSDPAPTDPDAVGLATVMNERFKAIMNAYGDEEKKVWITELGWNSAHNDEETQAQALAKSFRVLDTLVDPQFPDLGPYVDKYIWFKYDSWAESEEWGLLDRERARRKPAYDAFEALTPKDGSRPPLEPRVDGGGIYWGAESDADTPFPISQDDLVTGIPPDLPAGNAPLEHLVRLSDGKFNPDNASVRAVDGVGEDPLTLLYRFPEPVDISAIRIYAGDTSELPARVFLSCEIRVNGAQMVADLRAGAYGQLAGTEESPAVSIARWESEEEGKFVARGVQQLEIAIYPTTSMYGDFRDRWTPVDYPDDDIDGAGPAYLFPILKEIDVIGRRSNTQPTGIE